MWQVPRDAMDAAPALTQITSDWRKVHILTRSATCSMAAAEILQAIAYQDGGQLES